MDKLRESIIKANEAYRTGAPIISDEEFDTLMDQLDEDDPLRDKIGVEVSGERKEKLPYPMFSMDKIKTIEELQDWYKSKGIGVDTEMIITPKYDGLSFLVSPNGAFTRGNGIEGQRSDKHLEVLNSSKTTKTIIRNDCVIGEVIMKRATFNEKYANDYKNPRNLVAGMFNKKDPQDSLKDVEYVCYGISEELTVDKDKALETLNKSQDNQVPFLKLKASEVTHEVMEKSFEEWKQEFEIDGIIVEVNDDNLRKQLGRERNNNPAYARAYKGFKAESVWTTIKGITYGVSKEGKLCPVAQVEPVNLGGVTISNVTLNNPKFVREMCIVENMKVEIIRSGDVIPKVINVEDGKAIARMPEECPCCGSKVEWDETKTFLMCRNAECPAQQLEKLISFFTILGVDNVGEGVCKQLYDTGYKTVYSVLNLDVDDLMQIEGFQKRKAALVHENIHNKLKDVPLEKLQHASNLFHGLGSKKLKLLNHFDSPTSKPTMEEIVKIDGFSEKSAQVYLDGFDTFWEYIYTMPITIKKKVEEVKGGKCEGWSVCFTGVRSKDIEETIMNNGGKIASGVSKNTTHVVAKDVTSNSGKVKKANDLGITLMSLDEIIERLK